MAEDLKELENKLKAMVLKEAELKDQLDKARYDYENLLEEYARECSIQNKRMSPNYESRYWGF